MIFIHFVSFLFFKTLHQMGNGNLSGLLLEIWHICYKLFCFSSYSELCFCFDLQCLLDNSIFFLRALQCAEFVGLLMIQIITFFAMYWLFCVYPVFLVFQHAMLFLITYSKFYGRLHYFLFAYLQCLYSTLYFVDCKSLCFH